LRENEVSSADRPAPVVRTNTKRQISRCTNEELMAQWRWRHQYIHRALSSPLRWLGAKRHWGSSSSIRPTDGDVNHSVYCWHTHQSTSI